MQLWWQSNFSPFDCYKSIPPSVLKDILAGYGILCGPLFSFSTSALNMLLPCLLSYTVLTRSLQCYFVVILSICLYTQLYLVLCNPLDGSPPGFFVHGIFQARALEWVAIPSSRESTWFRDWISVSYISCIGRWILYHWASWELVAIILCVFVINVSLDASKIFSFITFFHFYDNVFVVYFCLQLMELFVLGA